jgi:cholest-4-en-3-one 26-monooxygenase
MLGIPREDRHQVFEWSNTMIASDDPEWRRSPDQAAAAAAAMYAYANELAVQRREDPRDDLVSVLMRAEVDGEHLTEVEFDLFFLLLAVAGNETTRNLISGGMLALLEHPDEWRRLREDRSLVDTAVEEMLRWVTPVMLFQRTAQRDTSVAGVPVAEGERVALYYSSGNRDETAFPEPERFDVGRAPNEHITFGGGGPHFCLGANLARMEIRTMFDTLIERMPDIEQSAPARRLRSNFINGLKSMPVRYPAS